MIQFLNNFLFLQLIVYRMVQDQDQDTYLLVSLVLLFVWRCYCNNCNRFHANPNNIVIRAESFAYFFNFYWNIYYKFLLRDFPTCEFVENEKRGISNRIIKDKSSIPNKNSVTKFKAFCISGRWTSNSQHLIRFWINKVHQLIIWIMKSTQIVSISQRNLLLAAVSRQANAVFVLRHFLPE